jgi:hypothetical protein
MQNFQQAIEFAVMAGNEYLLRELMTDDADLVHIVNEGGRTDQFHPFHTAANYLQGASSCCTVMLALSDYVFLKPLHTNELRHTVLDALMLGILKSHTSCSPNIANRAHCGEAFVGEEMSICGR